MSTPAHLPNRMQEPSSSLPDHAADIPGLSPHEVEAERERVAALHATGLMDTPPEQIYDEITDLAAEICQTPVCLITLIDEARQWFKSAKGMPCMSLPRSASFCAVTIRQNSMLVVPDLTADPRFSSSPSVTSGPHIRFYAGEPIRSASGHPIGTLVVLDFAPRTLKPEQTRALRTLARQVEAQIVLREQVGHMQRAATERQKLMDALAASEAQFRAFMDCSPIAAYIKDSEGRMQYYNRSLATLYGITTQDWIGKSDGEIWPAENAATYRSVDQAVLRQNCEIEVEERSPQPNGDYIYWRSYKFPLVDGNGSPCVAGVSLNVTQQKCYEAELRAANQKLEELTRLDPLTGVGNRRALTLTLEQTCQAPSRNGRAMGLLMLDVDHFKRLNDTFGHPRGDEVLRRIGEVLRRIVRRVDHVCRFGGEEFAIVVPEADIDGLLALGERVRAEIAALPFEFGQVTVSVGAALYNAAIDEPTTLLARADSALYNAKREGRNRVLIAA